MSGWSCSTTCACASDPEPADDYDVVAHLEELQWYLDEFRAYYNEHRANQAVGGQPPAAFGRDSPGAEVISLDEVRCRRLVRRRFAHGLLNAYELVEERAAG